MAQVVGNNQVKLNDGKVVSAQQGGWYDGQQFWGGTLSNPGQINSKSDQIGAGQNVSAEVIAQTNPGNVSYVQQQQQKAGVNPVAAAASTMNPGGAGVPSGGGSGVGFTAPETINLPQLYESLYSSSGIRDIEADLKAKTDAYTEEKGKINDNPFLSEATRVGRVAKIEQLYNERTLNQRNEIAQKKADIEMKLNLQSKQFDINSQAAQQALSTFTALVSSGALNNASGEDIANITRSTGLSSSMIQGAIEANRAKNLQTSVQSFDDGVNEGFQVFTIDPYGNIVNTQRQVTGPSSKSSSGSTGIFDTLGGGSTGSSGWRLTTSTGSGKTSSVNISDGWGSINASSASSSKPSSSAKASVQPPNYTPSGGIGTVWTDPATGQKFQYTKTGWAIK